MCLRPSKYDLKRAWTVCRLAAGLWGEPYAALLRYSIKRVDCKEAVYSKKW